MIDVTLFILYVLGVHTAFSFYWWTAFPIPYILCGVASVLALPRIVGGLIQIRMRNSWSIPAFLIFATAVTLLTADVDNLDYSLRGVGQLVYSIGMAVSLYWLVLRIPRKRLSLVCLALLIVLAAVSALEALGPLKGIVESAVAWLSPNWNYNADTRDLVMAGAIRSKAFAPEPSIAAGTFLWLSMLYLWSCPRIGPLQLTMWMTLLAVSLWAIRSPVFLLTLICGALLAGARRLADHDSRAPTMPKLRMVPVIFAIVLNLAVLLGAFNIFYERTIATESGEGSFIMRISGPFVFTRNFLMEHPILGVGVVGDLRGLTDEIEKAYDTFGLRMTESVEKSVSNRLALHFVYFGGVGSVVTILLLMKSAYLDDRLLRWLFFSQVLSILIMAGGYNNAPMWCQLSSILAVARVKLFFDRRMRPRRFAPSTLVPTHAALR